MAVPPKAAKIISEAVLKTFAGVNYDWVYANITDKRKNEKVSSNQEEMFVFQPAIVAG